MKRDTYKVEYVLSVLSRIGFSTWEATDKVTLLNHPTTLREVMIDNDEEYLPAVIISRKIVDADILEAYFESLYDAEL